MLSHADKKMCHLQGSSFHEIDACLKVAEIQVYVFFFANIPEEIPLHFGTWHFLWRAFPTNRWFWCLDTTDINGWHPSFLFSKKRWHTNSVKELPIQNSSDTMLWVMKRWPGSAIFIHDPENHRGKTLTGHGWNGSHTFSEGRTLEMEEMVRRLDTKWGEVHLVSWHDVFGIIWM